MLYSLNHVICFCCILFKSIFNSNANTINCDLPERCRIGNDDDLAGYYFRNNPSIFCDINDDAFEFKFKEPTSLNITANKKCVVEKNLSLNTINFNWMTNDLEILEKKFNFTNVIKYFAYFEGYSITVKFWNLKGFDFNFLDKNYSLDIDIYKTIYIYINNCQLDFYHNKKNMLTIINTDNERLFNYL